MRRLETFILSIALLASCRGGDVTHVRVPKVAASAAAPSEGGGNASSPRAARESGLERGDPAKPPGSERRDAR